MTIRTLAGLVCGALWMLDASPPSAQQATVVSVGGRRVEVMQLGTGAPSLVLESGAGEGAGGWRQILPELAKQTRVIAYSRAGLGASDPGAPPRSPQSSVAELHQLLQALGERGPIVLAGHSWGGLLARLYVSTFPTDVAGLVLIDGSHEAQFSRWDALQRGPGIGDLVREVTRTLPAPMRAEYDQMLEVQAMQRVSGMKPLPDLPLAVITAMKPCPPEREWTCRDPQAMAVWRQNHDEWFARSTTALRIVSADSGHYVPIDQPGLIIDAVRFVLEQVRRSTR